MLTDEIIEKLQVNEAELTSNMLHDLVEEQRGIGGSGRLAKELEDRYEQRGLPIQTRVSPNKHKVDERLPNDFYGDIVDTKTGYMGNAVSIELPEEGYADKDRDALADWLNLTDAVDRNSEMVRAAAIGGRGYRMLYIPEGESEVAVKRLPASETVVYKDGSLQVPVYAMRYWKVKDTEYRGVHGTSTERTRVEWYNDTNMTVYMDDGRGNYRMIEKPKPHLFNGVPIIEFPNNEHGMAQPYKAIKLIDAYDTVASATVSEIEQLRLAYLALKGAGGEVDDKFMNVLQQTGIFPLAADGDAKFITKDLSVDGVKIVLDELRRNIYAFSDSIDMSKDFGGDMRVIGWQVALMPLENSCIVTERKFKAALREQYRMVCEKWREWGYADIDYLDLQFTFTRNFPKDLEGEAKILAMLLGNVSRKTAYAQMSFIEDVDAEIEAFENDESAVTDELFPEDREPDEVTEPEGGPEGGNVQAQALNGAQIKSLVDIASQVALGQLPAETATEILLVAIPSLTPQDASDIISPAANFEVENANTQPPQQPPVVNQPADEAGDADSEGDN